MSTTPLSPKPCHQNLTYVYDPFVTPLSPTRHAQKGTRMASRHTGAPRITAVSCYLELDLDINASRQVEAHERIDSVGRRVKDVDQALVRAHLKLLA